MANTTSKVTLEKVTINGVVQTEKTRYARIKALVETAELPDIERDDLIKFVEHKLAQVENRKSGKVSEEKQAARDHIRKAVIDFLTANEGWFTTSEIVKKSPDLGIDYSVSSVASILTALRDEGIVLNDKVKKSSVYTLAR